jgi:predicted CXXCH cytochrome family protein
VVDSRVKIVERNPHFALKKVPDTLNLPEFYRLDRNNEIYCGTCHTLHDFTESTEVGSTPFMRTDNQRSQMCITCHAGKTEQQGYANHPVLKQASDIIRPEAARNGPELGPDRELICQSCHNAHGKRAMVAPLNDSTLCVMCHQNKKSLINGKHDLRLTLPDVKNIKQQRPSESGPCGACHIPHNAAGQKLWAKRLNPGIPASQMCLTCHDEQSGVKTKRIGRHSHPTNVKPVSGQSPPKELPLFSPQAGREPAGSVQCFTCHNAHQWDPTSPDNLGAKNLEGDESNSFLRVSNSASSELCVKCHSDKKQVAASDHNLKFTAPEEKNTLGFTAGRAGPCGACHIPHNAAGLRLWAKPLAGDTPLAAQLCAGCHRKAGAAKNKLIGDYSHPLDVTLQKLNIPGSDNLNISKLPLYGDDGKKIPAGKMVCLTCHEPHTWDPNKSSPDLNKTFQNIEGDAANSFLREANFPSSNLCKSCHPAKSRVDKTEHDLMVTAPSSKNIAGQTVLESGTCGVCHFVHNSRSDIVLWARGFGTGNNIMETMCNSCHSPEEPARSKVPPVYLHPREKVIKVKAQNKKGLPDYFPLFHGGTGTPVTAGNLSCPSCHNVHQWNPESPAKGTGVNSEGDASNSFLRSPTSFALCQDCHGKDAPFKIKYYHDPAKRKFKGIDDMFFR